MSGSVVEDKIREAVGAAGTLAEWSAGLVPPIRLACNAVTAAWQAAAATANAWEARNSWRERSFEERKTTFEQTRRVEEEAQASRDELGAMLVLLVFWPFLALLLLMTWPSALPSRIPSSARVALAITLYGSMLWFFPTWLFPTLVKQLDGWWRWAVIVAAFGPFVGALTSTGIAWLVTVVRRT